MERIFYSHVNEDVITEDFPEDEELFEEEPAEEAIVGNREMVDFRIGPFIRLDEELGARPIDEAHDWSHFLDVSFTKLEVFQFIKECKQSVARFVHQSEVQNIQLTDEQQVIVNECLYQIKEPNYKIKRIFVQGNAGTGNMLRF